MLFKPKFMKKKKLNLQKLVLSKQTIYELANKELNAIKGGAQSFEPNCPQRTIATPSVPNPCSPCNLSQVDPSGCAAITISPYTAC